VSPKLPIKQGANYIGWCPSNMVEFGCPWFLEDDRRMLSFCKLIPGERVAVLVNDDPLGVDHWNVEGSEVMQQEEVTLFQHTVLGCSVIGFSSSCPRMVIFVEKIETAGKLPARFSVKEWLYVAKDVNFIWINLNTRCYVKKCNGQHAIRVNDNE